MALPHLVLARPAWEPGAAVVVESDRQAAEYVAQQGFSRVFLTTGRSGTAAFVDSAAWFLIRAVTAPNSTVCRDTTNYCYPAGPTTSTTNARCCEIIGSMFW